MDVAQEATSRTLRSILCGKRYWTTEESGRCRLHFHENGRGELWCGAEHSVWVCAETTWRVLPPEILDQTISVSSNGQLVEFELQLTLEKDQPPNISPVEIGVNERTLAPEAFSSTRKFTVRLIKGRFPAPYHLTHLRLLKEHGFVENAEEEAEELARIESESLKYSLKLEFDKSPWPEREHWIDRTSMLDEIKYWDGVDFVNPEWRSF